MLVSILMSVYNAASTLEMAINSILDQSFSDFEFIICDDASTDRSWEIISDYAHKDSRIAAIRNVHNQGLGASLNCCLKISKGIYIARQDADDVSLPDRLELTLRFLQNENLPYAACGVFVFDDTGIWSQRIFPQEVTKHIIAQKNPFFHPTMIFKREVLESVNGYRVAEETRRVEDYDLVMRLAARGIIGMNLQKCLYGVYEPPQAYQRRTFKSRCAEIKVRFHGLRLMRSPFYDYLYLIKPVIVSLIPLRLLKAVKKFQWRNARRSMPDGD